MTAALTMAAPELTYEALLHASPAGPDWAGSWTVTFGFGKPAQGTYTEVAFASNVLDSLRHDESVSAECVLEEVVRRVAVDLYGTAWAFVYRPDQYEQAVARWGLRRRERVVVTSIEVWSS